LPRGVDIVPVTTADRDGQVKVRRGRVRCQAFPFVVLTSNGEREFPPAFLRRCLRLDLQPPDPDQLAAILTAHLGIEAATAAERYVEQFLARRERSEVTTDQLLNAVYIATAGSRYENRSADEIATFDEVVDSVMRPLTGTGAG
jgi:MoxR-like ATPase